METTFTSLSPVRIRMACPRDAQSLLAIYRPYVEQTAITFEYQVPTVEEFMERIRHTLETYPYLAAEEEGDIIGYAYASPFKNRAAYDWAAEASIYVSMDRRRHGIGKALYRSLEDCLKKQNILNLNACITYPNPESVGFHEALGYRTTARFTKCGYKLGQWHDIIWMEKFLGDHPQKPKAVLPIRELSLSL